MDPSLPQKVPGQGACPPGYRPGSYKGQQPGSSACVPIGPAIPIGGWKPTRSGFGPGYPPTAADASRALATALSGETEGEGGFTDRYSEWLRSMGR